MKKFIKDSYSELQKVTWPTKDHAVAITILTVVFTAIATLVLTVVDGTFKEFYSSLLEISPKAEFQLPEFDASNLQITDSEGNPVDASNFEIKQIDSSELPEPNQAETSAE